MDKPLFQPSIMRIFLPYLDTPFGHAEMNRWLDEITCVKINGLVNPAMN
jgi:hypothetical protein